MRAAIGPARGAGLDVSERQQLAVTGHLEPLVVPAGNPLSLVEARTRAVAVLLTLGESPRRVGEVVLDAPRRTAARRARAALRAAQQIIRPATIHLHSRRRARLARIVANDRCRWTLLLRVSGAFASVDEIAHGMSVDRATCYRYLKAATKALIDFSARDKASA
jgi:hypothetical protein